MFFFFNDPATTEIYTLSLHDALPICLRVPARAGLCPAAQCGLDPRRRARSDPHRPGSSPDRKSTRLNSSHITISYAVFCLKKKTEQCTGEKSELTDLWPYSIISSR